jgi:3-oxoacyl-[acyl-carrier-protein] synthase-1/3-oxoacyl-[acyl-carrier-protein] synthase II
MTPAVVIAAAGVSPLGSGRAAWDPRAETSAVRRDPALAAAGLKRPFVARAGVELSPDEDRATALLVRAVKELVLELNSALPGWRGLRVGLALGTSGGGVATFADLVPELDAGRAPARERALRAPYFGPVAPAIAALGVEPEPLSQVLVACASSTFAIGIAARWLELDAADLVIAGGYDALSPFIAAGFESLGATSERPMPFRAQRDGLALGEGAGLLALVCGKGSDPPSAFGRVLGFGVGSDAVHATAPDREGSGLFRAASAALSDADCAPETIQLVSAHGTATPYNDAAESHAIRRALGEAAKRAVVFPFKGVIGHTLGAAGVLETLSALTSMQNGCFPAALGDGDATPELQARLLDRPEPGTPQRCLKLSSAFGGANVSLVLGPRDASAKIRERSDVSILAIGSPVTEFEPGAVSRALGVERDRIARLDGLSQLALAAVARLGRRPIQAAGVVVGSVLSTLEIDADFERRRRARGPEPRRFPATSPNLAPGNCSIALGLVGPSLAVGADLAAPLEALLIAHDLVALGDAEEILVVALDSGGPCVKRLFDAAGLPLPAPGALALLVGRGARPPLRREELARRLRELRSGLPGQPGWPALVEALRALGNDGDLPS